MLAANGLPGAQQLLWIIVAMVAARSAAMAFNRLADRRDPRPSCTTPAAPGTRPFRRARSRGPAAAAPSIVAANGEPQTSGKSARTITRRTEPHVKLH